MSGFLLTAKKVGLWNRAVEDPQLRGAIISIVVGVLTGLFVSMVKLHMGLPGHKALLWMTPILVTRLATRCKIGATVGSCSTAFTVFALGENLAGGIVGLPLIGLAGVILDYMVRLIEKANLPVFLSILTLGFGAMTANIICLGKRLCLPLLAGAHVFSIYSDMLFRLISYALCGLLAGVLAAVLYFMARQYGKKKSLNKIQGAESSDNI
jgi:hypothetical protein